VKHPVKEGVEEQQKEAADLAAHKEKSPEQVAPEDDPNPMVGESLGQKPDLHPRIEGDCLILDVFRSGYPKDPVCSKVLKKLKHYTNFKANDGLLYTKNCSGDIFLCVPAAVHQK